MVKARRDNRLIDAIEAIEPVVFRRERLAAGARRTRSADLQRVWW